MNKSAFIFYFLAVFIASISQILLKSNANERSIDNRNKYMNVKVLVAYGIFVLSMLIGTLALKKIEYKYAAIIESMSYFFVLIGSRVAFNEKITRRRLSGISIIAVGIIVFML